MRDLLEDFAWGAATAAFQIEGASKEDGRGSSIWDDLCDLPNRIIDKGTGEVAVDFYHRHSEDISIMKDLGIKNFRMSFSWPRLLPDGTTKHVNQKGVDFYNKVLDELLAAGI